MPAVRPAADAGAAKPVAPAPSSGAASAKVETSPSAAPAAVTTGANPAPAAAKDAPKDAKDAKGKKTVVAARDLFGASKTPAPLKARAIGWYAKGCLAGAKPLAIDGSAWQVMRLSRNRNWGHPELIALVERLAEEVKKYDSWPGLLVGDIAQPRGGPMTSGHASHQVGLDADIWLTPMPDRRLTEKEREELSATSMLAADEISVDPKVWGDGQVKIIKRAASYRAVERVLVHPAIKKALCEAAGSDKGWLAKVRPYWGHYYHMHIRVGCPSGSSGCTSQPPPPGGDGCGAELKDWIKLVTPKKPSKEPKREAKTAKPSPKKKPITMADLPADCRSVLAAGEPEPKAVAGADAKNQPAAKTAEKTKSAQQ
jgi:penicillin-insensitive murein endopeptidase